MCRWQFHPLESNTIVSVDDTSRAHVWNGDTAAKGKDFGLLDSRHTAVRTSAVCWMNDHTSPLLATGSTDGIVRLWSDVTEPRVETRLQCAFAALPEVNTDERGSGLIVQVRCGHANFPSSLSMV